MKRVIYSDDGTLSDFTYSLNDIYADTQAISLVAADDKIYIGSDLPFNNFYIDIGTTVNAQASVLSIKVWDGSVWNSTVEVYDGTSSGGASLAQSGVVRCTPNRDKGWGYEDTDEITELADVTIYDKYWVQLTFSADLTADVVLNWVGNIFSNDNDMQAEFPDLMRTEALTAFETGKTNWREQHQIAGKLIEKDLISKRTIYSADQIFSIEDLALASTQKVASIIYNQLGDDFIDQYKAAEKEYNLRLSKSYIKIDKNKDGNLSKSEKLPISGRIYR